MLNSLGASMLCLLLGATDPSPESLTGEIRLTRTVAGSLVSVIAEGKAVRLEGELVPELTRLASARVEVLGQPAGKGFLVRDYRILDVGGVKPLVGILDVDANGAFRLRDGDGSDIPLNLPPRTKERLFDQAGAKVWVHGTRLLSGQLKVLTFGVLRDAPKPEPKLPPKPTLP